MPYLKKICKLPHRIEVEEVHSSRYGCKGIKPMPRQKKTPEEVKKTNERNRIKRLYRKIAMNFDYGDFHMQLTYRENERPMPEEAREVLREFFRQLRKVYKSRGQELKYIITTEYEDKAIHHHLIVNEIGMTAKLIQKTWGRGIAFMNTIYENGDVKDLAYYLIKESQNSFKDLDTPSKLSYSCSRNLIMPIEKVKIVSANTWAKEPVPPQGYWIPKDSVITGISKVTGYPYRYYTCIQYDPEKMTDEENYIKPRRRKNGNKIKPNDKPKPG